MKQVVIELPEETELVTIKQMFDYISNNEDAIIAYITSGNNGLGVSCMLNNGDHGFIYHSDLMKFHMWPDLHARFIASTETESLKKVIDSGRKLLVFNDFNEFLKFSANHTKY